MSMTPEELQRKVRQNDGDIQAIYELVSSISIQQTRHLRRLDGVEQRLTERIDGLEGRFDGLEGRFDGLERRFDGLEGRFDGLEGRFDGLEGRFDGVETTLVEVLRRLPEPPA